VGNPIGLVNGVASGVVDFFYEPGSALFTNPSEFGSALGKGTMALVGGTIGGTMNTVSKMTGERCILLDCVSCDTNCVPHQALSAKD
jgi:vacuolar protein sorting-associated protein 13A/C